MKAACGVLEQCKPFVDNTSGAYASAMTCRWMAVALQDVSKLFMANDAAKAFSATELQSMQNRFRVLNDDFGQEASPVTPELGSVTTRNESLEQFRTSPFFKDIFPQKVSTLLHGHGSTALKPCLQFYQEVCGSFPLLSLVVGKLSAEDLANLCGKKMAVDAIKAATDWAVGTGDNRLQQQLQCLSILAHAAVGFRAHRARPAHGVV